MDASVWNEPRRLRARLARQCQARRTLAEIGRNCALTAVYLRRGGRCTFAHAADTARFRPGERGIFAVPHRPVAAITAGRWLHEQRRRRHYEGGARLRHKSGGRTTYMKYVR